MLADAMHYGRWLPPMLTTHGGDIDKLITILHYFMAALFIGWGIFYCYCVLNFRARPGHKATYQPVKGKVSKYLEVAVALFEVFLLVGLSSPVWAKYKNDKPGSDQNPLTVRVTAKQFEWQFHYPGPDGKFSATDPKFITESNPAGLNESDPAGKDDLVFVNEFYAPTGRPIILEITSRDVIHSFFIPTMRVKQDAVPGMRIPIWFTINEDATTAKISQEMTQEFPIAKAEDWYRLRHHVAVEDYKGKDGVVILAKGDTLGQTLEAGGKAIEKLKAAGITSLKMTPRNPLEVVCAQLCGNNHYTMKAQIYTFPQAEFNKWYTDAVEKKNKPVDMGF